MALCLQVLLTTLPKLGPHAQTLDNSYCNLLADAQMLDKQPSHGGEEDPTPSNVHSPFIPSQSSK